MDRITSGLALKESTDTVAENSIFEKYKYWIIAGVSSLAFLVLSQFFPWLTVWPESWKFYPAEAMNNAILWLLSDCRLLGIDSVPCAIVLEKMKEWSFFFLMLPSRIGLEQTISPYSWGFELTNTHITIYWIAVATLVLWSIYKNAMARALTILFFAILFAFGLTKLPWPVLVLATTLLGWQLGGWRLAVGILLTLGFLLIGGVWPQAMLSLYLCGLAVAISFLLGTLIGVLASEVDAVSAFLRPINDTLQTMPLFVILIPFVMLFKVGEFTALLAIIAYSIVPAIRYSEHGLRNLPKEVLEAADCMGCTRLQLLWQVKLPLALPVLMLGLNQTIMYGISMLVIAALVGTNGLGQQVYIGMGDGDFGIGIIAGLGMAAIAIIADRMTQGWSKARQEAFGL